MLGHTPNYPDSQDDVITSMTHVLLSFEDMVKAEMTNIQTVYDEQLSYETGLRLALAKHNYNDTSSDPVPLLIYNRTVLIDSELAIGKRLKNNQGCVNVNGQVVNYSMTLSEFDLNFLYASKSVQKTEQFEVVYNSEEGLTGSKELIVDMGELGEFKYFLDYQELTEYQIGSEDVYYKGIIGSIKVRGIYFTFRSKVNGLIESINQRIISSKIPSDNVVEEIVSSNTIT